MTASNVIKGVNTFIAVLLLAMTPSMCQHTDSVGSHLLILHSDSEISHNTII